MLIYLQKRRASDDAGKDFTKCYCWCMVFIKHGSVFSSSRPDCAPRYWFQQGINKISDGTGGHHRMCFGLVFLTFITGTILFLPFKAGCTLPLYPCGRCSSLFRRQSFADVPSDEKRQTEAVRCRAMRATTPSGLLQHSPRFARRVTTGSKMQRCVAHRVLYVWPRGLSSEPRCFYCGPRMHLWLITTTHEENACKRTPTCVFKYLNRLLKSQKRRCRGGIKGDSRRRWTSEAK